MNIATIWLIVKALAAITPLIVRMVMERKITSANEDDIIFDITAEFERRLASAAQAQKEIPDETDDPYNRARSRSNSVG